MRLEILVVEMGDTINGNNTIACFETKNTYSSTLEQ